MVAGVGLEQVMSWDIETVCILPPNLAILYVNPSFCLRKMISQVKTPQPAPGPALKTNGFPPFLDGLLQSPALLLTSSHCHSHRVLLEKFLRRRFSLEK